MNKLLIPAAIAAVLSAAAPAAFAWPIYDSNGNVIGDSMQQTAPKVGQTYFYDYNGVPAFGGAYVSQGQKMPEPSQLSPYSPANDPNHNVDN